MNWPRLFTALIKTLFKFIEQPVALNLAISPQPSLAKTERKALKSLLLIRALLDTKRIFDKVVGWLVPMSTFFPQQGWNLAKSSKKSSKTELTTASRTKEIIRISPSTCPVLRTRCLSPATALLLLSVMCSFQHLLRKIITTTIKINHLGDWGKQLFLWW